MIKWECPLHSNPLFALQKNIEKAINDGNDDEVH